MFKRHFKIGLDNNFIESSRINFSVYHFIKQLLKTSGLVPKYLVNSRSLQFTVTSDCIHVITLYFSPTAGCDDIKFTDDGYLWPGLQIKTDLRKPNWKDFKETIRHNTPETTFNSA